jgi:Spore germination protein
MKKMIYFIITVLLMTVFTACHQNEDTNQKKEAQFKIYYINNTETKVVSEPYVPKSKDKKNLVSELLNAMNKSPENLTYKQALPDGVSYKNYTLNNNGQLTLNFDANYYELSGVPEILCRAAIVKTLSQIDGVKYIEFYVENQPLMDGNEKPIGFMEADDFIDDEEGNYNQKAIMTLYFADRSGKQLVETSVKVQYDGSVPMEQLILEQLTSGPDSIEGIEKGSILPVIPKGTQVIKTSIKDGVCYVDVSDKFLQKLPDITNKVAIYSVVNSLVEMSNVNKVQFTVNGKKVKTYAENVKFDSQFERNLEIVTK